MLVGGGKYTTRPQISQHIFSLLLLLEALFVLSRSRTITMHFFHEITWAQRLRTNPISHFLTRSLAHLLVHRRLRKQGRKKEGVLAVMMEMVLSLPQTTALTTTHPLTRTLSHWHPPGGGVPGWLQGVARLLRAKATTATSKHHHALPAFAPRTPTHPPHDPPTTHPTPTAHTHRKDTHTQPAQTAWRSSGSTRNCRTWVRLGGGEGGKKGGRREG